MIRINRYNCTILIVLMTAFLFCGCKKNKLNGLVSVQGTILYKGEPLKNATVSFSPKDSKPGNRIGNATTNSQGRFELRTIGELGVLPDEYSVSVVKNEIQTLPAQKKQQSKTDPKTGRTIPQRPEAVKFISVIPDKYKNPATSGLEFTIGSKGDRGIEINLMD